CEKMKVMLKDPTLIQGLPGLTTISAQDPYLTASLLDFTRLSAIAENFQENLEHQGNSIWPSFLKYFSPLSTLGNPSLASEAKMIAGSAIIEKQVTDWILASSKRKQWLIDGMDKKVNSSALKEINKQRYMLRSRYTNSQPGSLDAERMTLNETAPPDFHYPNVKAKVQESCHKEKLCFESLISYLTFGPISFLKPLNRQAGIHQLIQLLELAIALVEKQD
ncbi:hypothetical protein DFH28DRAFT_831127, partial [Melampsora americana]